MALSKPVLIFCVVLRLLTLGALTASIVVLVTNRYTDTDGTKNNFKDFIFYRYVLSTACIGCFYTLLQLPFAIYYAHKEKRLIRNDFLPNFDFYGDKIISIVLASGVGAGFGVTYELKRYIKNLFGGLLAEDSLMKFFDKTYIAVALLLIGCLSTAWLSIFSSINKSASTKGFFR